MPVVGVAPLPAEGGYLHREAAGQDSDRAVLQTGIQTWKAGAAGQYLPRQGGGGHIVVMGRGWTEGCPGRSPPPAPPDGRTASTAGRPPAPCCPSLSCHSPPVGIILSERVEKNKAGTSQCPGPEITAPEQKDSGRWQNWRKSRAQAPSQCRCLLHSPSRCSDCSGDQRGEPQKIAPSGREPGSRSRNPG